MPTAKPIEIITVVAIILGPVLALFAQRALDWMREQKKQRVQLFLSLMATRALQLTPEHVKALNSIDVVFNRKKDKGIRDAWHSVMRHMESDTTKPGWIERVNDLKADLYLAMGKAVGYNYTIDYLKREIYLPKYFNEVEQDQAKIRQGIAKILTDDGLKVKIVEPPGPAAPHA